MEISYDALKAMIQKMFEEMKAAEKNEFIDQYELATGKEMDTRSYCMKLVAPEMRKSFIKQVDTIEKATKGALKTEHKEYPMLYPQRESKEFLRWAKKKYPNARVVKQEGEENGRLISKRAEEKKLKRIRVGLDAPKKNPDSKKLTKKMIIKIIDDVIEEEDLIGRTRGEQTETRQGLFPGWEGWRQLSKGIVSPNEAKKKEKKNCSKGQIYHDSDGRWSSKADAKVYSLKFAGKGKKNCKRGQARMPGQRFLKIPCGRKDAEGKQGKEPFKCKDGKPVD